MKTIIYIIAWLMLTFAAFGGGRSEQMIRDLNAQPPEWLSIAEPIRVEQLEESEVSKSASFRPRSGGAVNSRNRVILPGRDIEYEFPYEIHWTGINEEGTGVSLSPKGNRLIVSSGMNSILYEIQADDQLRQIPTQIPNVTYDEGLKGFILRWAWVGEDILIGNSEITDETGHEVLEERLYVYYMKEQALARLDLGALMLGEATGIEVAGIGTDLSLLKIRRNGEEFTVNADLRSPPRLLARRDAAAHVDAHHFVGHSAKVPERQGEIVLSEITSRPISWVLVIGAIPLAAGVLWLLCGTKGHRRSTW